MNLDNCLMESTNGEMPHPSSAQTQLMLRVTLVLLAAFGLMMERTHYGVTSQLILTEIDQNSDLSERFQLNKLLRLISSVWLMTWRPSEPDPQTAGHTGSSNKP